MAERCRWSFTSLVLFVALISAAGAQDAAHSRPALRFQNSEAVLSFDLLGGALADFHLTEKELNPFTWGQPKEGDRGVHGFGHFLCLDRWGPASDAEAANGMPYHGEAPNVTWTLDPAAQSDPDTIVGSMSATLPMAGLRVERRVEFATAAAFAIVRETVINQNKLGRVYNMVQHPTVGPPFLDADTVVDCNGAKGFAQGGAMPNPEQPSSQWPVALTPDGRSVDLRHLSTNAEPAVVSFAIDGEYGWITATSASRGLMVGYLWRTRDYPWVSVWRDVHDGRPAARGLEFGTTGLHQPFPVLIKKARIFDRPVVQFLDAAEKVTRSYAIFLMPIPSDCAGIEKVAIVGKGLSILEKGKSSPRVLELKAGQSQSL